MTSDIRLSAEYQRDVAAFVDREVLTCASTLIYELRDVKKYSCDDEYLALTMGAPDKEETIENNGFEIRSATFERGEEYQWVNNSTDPKEFGEWCDSEEESIDECIDENCLDLQYREIFEHWIVSNFLGERLEQHGEVVQEFLGFTIWGRCTTGQAIHMDHVICSIRDEINNS